MDKISHNMMVAIKNDDIDKVMLLYNKYNDINYDYDYIHTLIFGEMSFETIYWLFSQPNFLKNIDEKSYNGIKNSIDYLEQCFNVLNSRIENEPTNIDIIR